MSVQQVLGAASVMAACSWMASQPMLNAAKLYLEQFPQRFEPQVQLLALSSQA